MANPNLLTASSVIGESTVTTTVGTGSTTLLTTAGSHLYRIVGVRIVNITNDTASSATMLIGGVEFLHQVSVAANATLDVITKEFPLYLKENVALTATATAASALRVLIVYEDVS